MIQSQHHQSLVDLVIRPRCLALPVRIRNSGMAASAVALRPKPVWVIAEGSLGLFEFVYSTWIVRRRNDRLV